MSHLLMMGPIQCGGPQATRSFVHGCSTAMTPHPAGLDAQPSGPSMHVAETSKACGQRRMVGRNSSSTDRSGSAAQAAQTMTVNGRSVARRGEVGEVTVPSTVGIRSGVRQQRHFARVLDRGGDLSLLLDGEAGDVA